MSTSRLQNKQWNRISKMALKFDCIKKIHLRRIWRRINFYTCLLPITHQFRTFGLLISCLKNAHTKIHKMVTWPVLRVGQLISHSWWEPYDQGMKEWSGESKWTKRKEKTEHRKLTQETSYLSSPRAITDEIANKTVEYAISIKVTAQLPQWGSSWLSIHYSSTPEQWHQTPSSPLSKFYIIH